MIEKYERKKRTLTAYREEIMATYKYAYHKYGEYYNEYLINKRCQSHSKNEKLLKYKKLEKEILDIFKVFGYVRTECILEMKKYYKRWNNQEDNNNNLNTRFIIEVIEKYLKLYELINEEKRLIK